MDREVAQSESLDASGSKLDRQRKPIQLSADVGDKWRIAIAQLELVQICRRPLDEELNRRKDKCLGGGKSA